MTADLQRALVERLTALADDELILGHRDSEWTGHAPMLEEDIALANLAQDEMGHALTWYELRSSLDGSDPDELVFARGPADYRNCRLVELPRGDWAFTMLRQFIFDAYEAELLPRLRRSAWPPLAEAATKIAREELFHLRHSGLWLERLALGTAESRRRLEVAIEAALPELPGLWAPLPGDRRLVDAGYFPAVDELAAAVRTRLASAFAAVDVGATLGPLGPDEPAEGYDEARAHGGSSHQGQDLESTRHQGSRRAELVELLATMQSVARADPEARSW